MADTDSDRHAESGALHDAVWGELLACYSEGEDTDWPYLTDLTELIVDMIKRHARGELVPWGSSMMTWVLTSGSFMLVHAGLRPRGS